MFRSSPRRRVGDGATAGPTREEGLALRFRAGCITRNLAGSLEMMAQLLCPIERNQGTHGDETTITLRESWTFPDVAKEHLVDEFNQLRREVTDQLLSC